MYQVSVPSSSTTASTTLLHPRVKQALAYLDCYLEDELLRYRRAKSGAQVAPSSARAMRPTDRAKLPVELAEFVPIDTLAQKKVSAVYSSEGVLASETANETASGVASESATPLAADVLASLAVIPEDGDAYSLDDLINHSGMEMLGDSYASPDAYLESSEELLRSLAQEEANVEHERNSLESLLTPFGIGSMMLMLVGSGMFGYLVMNPSTFTALGSGLTRLVSGFRGNTPASAPVVAVAAVQEGGEIPKESTEFMDLSLKSLVVMGTQGKGTSALRVPPSITPKANIPGSSIAAQSGMPTVVVPGQPTNSGSSNGPTGTAIVGTSASQSNAPQGNNAAPGNVVAQAKAKPSLYRPVQPQKPYQPSARLSAPQPVRTTELPPAPSTPTSIPPVVESVPVPATGGYRVEVPYTGDTDLEKAQKSDSGAYFKNGDNGAVIQMGETYSSREAAEAKAQQLKQQGFEGAEVQK
jgi:hypothetical protein